MIKKLLAVAIIVRLILLPFGFHSDVNNHVIWGIYAQEFGFQGLYDYLNFGNYARPDYPPLAILLFTLIKYLYDLLFSIIWKININIPLFPSGLVTWADHNGYAMLLKLPSIFADIGIGYLVYHWLKGSSQKLAVFASSLYLFNPSIIYISAVWGQIDSLAALPALLSLYLLEKKKLLLASLSLVLSLMLKATFAPMAIVFLFWIVKTHIDISELITSLLACLVLLLLLSIPFTEKNALLWIFEKYIHVFIVGPSTLPFLNLNAFNFWGAILGLSRIETTKQFLGLNLGTIAYSLGSIFIILTSIGYLRKKINLKVFTLCLYLSIFMFFPKIHERYLFPAVAVFPLIFTSIKQTKLKYVYFCISTVFFLNLYHWWWFPKIPILIYILDLEVIERMLSVTNMVLFGFLFFNSTTKSRS